MHKRGISTVVASVLIILITVAAVAIVWTAVIPMIKKNVRSTAEFETDLRIDISEGYTFYDSEKDLIGVQIRAGKIPNNLKKLKVGVLINGESYFKEFEALNINEKKTYYIGLNKKGVPEKIEVIPIYFSESGEQEGVISSEIERIPIGSVDKIPLGVVYLGESFYLSCQDILNNRFDDRDGLYIIDPDGSDGEIQPFEVYCDFDGEKGWTRIDYSEDLSLLQYFTGGDAWRWLPNDFTFKLSKEQILAIQSVSTKGKQTYVGKCTGVLHWYYTGGGTYAYSFGFKFISNETTPYGTNFWPGIDFSVTKDECKINGGNNLETVWEITDKRVPIINVQSRDSGDSGEKFGSPLKSNPAWLA